MANNGGEVASNAQDGFGNAQLVSQRCAASKYNINQRKIWIESLHLQEHFVCVSEQQSTLLC